MNEPTKPMTPEQWQKATEYVVELSRRIETSVSEKRDSPKVAEQPSAQMQRNQVTR